MHNQRFHSANGRHADTYLNIFFHIAKHNVSKISGLYCSINKLQILFVFEQNMYLLISLHTWRMVVTVQTKCHFCKSFQKYTNGSYAWELWSMQNLTNIQVNKLYYIIYIIRFKHLTLSVMSRNVTHGSWVDLKLFLRTEIAFFSLPFIYLRLLHISKDNNNSKYVQILSL